MHETSPAGRVTIWLAGFAAALERGDAAGAAELFRERCWWRDLVSFSWTLVTVEGRAAIARMLAATLAQARPRNWTIEGDATQTGELIEGWFSFETEQGRGVGHVRLKQGKCHTLLTTLRELKGFEERSGPRRERGVVPGVVRNRKSWLERREQEAAELGAATQPYCVIVGGGQGGLALAARLRRLDVPTIILDRHARPGDAWRSRYKQLCLHDPVWMDHLPYLPFPDDWPVYTPKDKLADWLEMYAKIMELNFWGGATCRAAQYDEASKSWTVAVERNGTSITLHPRQLVLATGLSGIPNMPTIPGAESFAGSLYHSSAHRSGEDFAGRRCVVVGSNNSAHDICADLWENGADVTMVQRSSTLVVRSDTLRALTTSRLYSETALERGIGTEKADLMSASLPHRLLPDAQRPIYEEIARRDADLYKGLRAAGFELDFGEDGSGLFAKYLRRGSGYYIDVGASALIASGEIKLRKGGIVRITPQGIVLADGSELAADLIVFAAGFGSMDGWAAQIISPAVAEKVGRCWGLGSGTTNDPGPWKGELRNMWCPTAQEGLWFHGGNLQQSRFYSQLLALQLKARMEGLATPIYQAAA